MANLLTRAEQRDGLRAELFTDSQVRALVRIAEHSLSAPVTGGPDTFVALEVGRTLNADFCSVWHRFQEQPDSLSGRADTGSASTIGPADSGAVRQQVTA